MTNSICPNTAGVRLKTNWRLKWRENQRRAKERMKLTKGESELSQELRWRYAK